MKRSRWNGRFNSPNIGLTDSETEVRRMFKTILVGLLIARITAPLVAWSAETRQGLPEIQDLPKITVRFYNYAGAPEHTVSGAHQQATRILIEAGVRLLWLHCTLNQQRVPQDPRCHQAQGPATISLLVCPREMAPKEGLPAGIFGFSLMPEKGLATSSRVYFHRLEELADGPKLRKGPLLGSMIAHEIGHLLLGVNSHSRRGLMSIPWDSEKSLKADLGQLRFSAKEEATIRAEAFRRLGVSIPPRGVPRDGEPIRIVGPSVATLPVLAAQTVAAKREEPGNQRTDRPTLSIRVYNVALVEPVVLARAKLETARIFREIEVETVWLDCPTTKEQLGVNRACAEPMQAMDLVIKILPKEMAEPFNQPREVYGLAVPGTNGGFGQMIYLFHHRILDLAFNETIATNYEDNQAIVFGNMMAHEAGHLLLGSNSHSKKGIMKSPWDRRDLHRTARTGLRFQPTEVERIRSELTKRSQAIRKTEENRGSSKHK